MMNISDALAMLITVAMLLIAHRACRISRSAIEFEKEFEKRKAKLDFLSRLLGKGCFDNPPISDLSLARVTFPDSKVIGDLLLSCEREADKLAKVTNERPRRHDANLSRVPFHDALMRLFKEMCADVGIPMDYLEDEEVTSAFLIGRYSCHRYPNAHRS